MEAVDDKANLPVPELDILIPVYNEGANIVRVLDALKYSVRSPFRILICYDFDEDDTLPVLASYCGLPSRILLVKNRRKGVLGAVVTGLEATRAAAVLILPADDDYNSGRIDAMLDELRRGCDIVCGSRFILGGKVSGFPWIKAMFVRTASFLLYHCARLPTHDASNGFRLFSRRVAKQIPIESREGHAYSIELLVKSHRLGWRIGEVPADWVDRKDKKSRFRVFKWMPTYFRWFCYALATTYLHRGPDSVRLHEFPQGANRNRNQG